MKYLIFKTIADFKKKFFNVVIASSHVIVMTQLQDGSMNKWWAFSGFSSIVLASVFFQVQAHGTWREHLLSVLERKSLLLDMIIKGWGFSEMKAINTQGRINYFLQVKKMVSGRICGTVFVWTKNIYVSFIESHVTQWPTWWWHYRPKYLANNRLHVNQKCWIARQVFRFTYLI